MAFRGIGDSATQVKMQQNQQALQAAQIRENARQADMNRSAQREARAQQASQFQASLGEQGRQFDVSQAAGADKTAWQKDFAERGMAQETGMAERKMNLAEFGASLQAMTAAADMEGKDADTKLRLAQLNQYVAATSDEEKRRANREKLAKGAFGSLAVSGLMNGGVMPVSAIELANRELGDKDNRIVGGGIDPESGIAFFDVQKADGSKQQLKMPPENQFAVLKEVYGDEVAGMFAANYKGNAAINAAIERAKIAAQAKSTADEAKATAAQKDPLKISAALRASGEAKLKAAGATMDMEAKNRLTDEATKSFADADRVLQGALPEGTKAPPPAEISPELLKANGVPPGYRTQIDPATGETTVYWRAGGKTMSMKVKADGSKREEPFSPAASAMGGLQKNPTSLMP